MRNVLFGLLTATAIASVATAGFAASPDGHASETGKTAAAPAPAHGEGGAKAEEATADAKTKKDEVKEGAPAAGAPAASDHGKTSH